MAEDVRIERVVSSGTVSLEGVEHPVATNTWIVGDDAEVVVIDPAHDTAAVLETVGEREVLAVICTCGLADHVAAARDVAARDEAPIAVHPRDRLLWHDTHPDADPEIEMEAGGVFEVAGAELRVLHTPGLTPGAVCLYGPELGVVFTGDTLLKGRPGAHGGTYPDFPTQLTSIGEHLFTLPPQTRVLPAHGEETTVGAEEPRFDAWITGGPQAFTDQEAGRP